MNIEQRLNVLVEKYHMQTKDFLKSRVASIIRELVKKEVIASGPRVIIRGLKESNEQYHPLLELLAEQVQIIGIMDKAPYAEEVSINENNKIPFLDLSLVAKEDICDFYIVNALHSGNTISYEIKENLQNKNKRILDLYTTMRMEYSLGLSKLYEEYSEERDFTHNRLKESIQLYQEAPTVITLRRLLAVCVSMKDFVTFFRFVEEAKTLLAQDKELVSFVDEIKALLEDIKKNTIALCGKKNVVVHWIDQVGFEEIGLLPKIEERIEQGLFFKKAYTVTPYTKPTARMIFWKEFRGFSDERATGGYDNVEIEQSSLYQNVLNFGYTLNLFGVLKEIVSNERDVEGKTEFSVASSVHYWEMLNQMLQEKTKGLYMVHVLDETHEPYISPTVSIQNNCYEFHASYNMSYKKIKQSAKYADDIIDFYSELLGNNVINIYMSDHGKWEDIDRRRYKNHAMHTFLGITNLGITGKVDRLFSYQDFDKLISWVLEMAAPEEMIFGDLPIYSPGFRAVIKERIQDDTEIVSGYKGIQTANEKYVRLDNGQEFFYVDGNEEENLIDCVAYKERILQLGTRYEELKEQILRGKE